ncbi:putative inorganic carbon transporter subunit DabA [Holospora elegans]|nr:putative inorganic carbon transporter subunit DabA [Holospora elegans]
MTSFSVVELLGIFSAFWMLVRTVSPVFAVRFFNYLIEKIRPCSVLFPSLDTISFEDQCYYAESIIKTINLSKNFSSLVVLCAHGSTTENNSYGTALHCGACSGHSGIGNAKVLAKILNEERVRNHLSKSKIFIPETTYFLAAEHNTTTDEVKLYPEGSYSAAIEEKINQLKKDLKEARKINSQRRSREMLVNKSQDKSLEYTTRKSADWAQVRPEWGLAKNASFFIAPWHITKKLDFEGRAFLHSYDYRQDLGGTILEQILTAPMIVAQWINAQYLFSTLDNGAYGSGSKITQNITGKVALMQGNASDLMNGLPFQSVYKNDTTSYHVPMRLITIVWAPWGGWIKLSAVIF